MNAIFDHKLCTSAYIPKNLMSGPGMTTVDRHLFGSAYKRKFKFNVNRFAASSLDAGS